MKRNLLILLLVFPFLVFSQSFYYDFNTDGDLEGFTQGGIPSLNVTSGNLELTDSPDAFAGGFQFIRTQEALNLEEGKYGIMRITFENLLTDNSGNSETFQILNYDTGSTNAGLAEKVDVTLPYGAGFSTIDIPIPFNASNDGVIDRLGFRVKLGSGNGLTGTLKIDQIIIVDSHVNVVSNFDFQNGGSDWGKVGGDVTFSIDPNGYNSDNAGKLYFDTTVTTINNLFRNTQFDVGENLDPQDITVYYDVFTNNTALEMDVRIQTFLDSDPQIFSTSGANVISDQGVLADTWGKMAINRSLPAFDKIRLDLRVKSNVLAQAGDSVMVDNVRLYAKKATPNLTNGEKNIFDFATDDTTGFTGNGGTVSDGGTTLDFNADGSTAVPKIFQNYYRADASNQSLYITVDANASNADEWSFYFKDASGGYIYNGWETLNSGSPDTMIVDLSTKPEWTGSITEFVLRFRNSGGANVDTNTISISKIAFFNDNESIAFGNWDNNATWLYGVPTATQNVTINNVVTVNTNAVINDVAVNSPELIVSAGNSLMVNGNLTTNNDVILNSNSTLYSSLIVEGTCTGNIIYSTFINGLNGTEQDNDLISSPVAVTDFTTIGLGGLVQDPNSDAVLFGVYNNATPAYEYWLTTDTGKSLTPGTGYVAGASADPGSLFNFEGTVTTTQVDVSITDETGAGGSDWNLIGNPYPSYISFQGFYDLATDEANGNTDNKLDSLFGIYGYDTDVSDGSIWTVWDKNNPNYATDLITPGQGFFVKARAGAGTTPDDTQITFLPSMRTIGSDDDFIAGRNANSNLATAIIKMNVASTTYNASLFFRDFNTNGIDVGYDTGAYDQNATGVFTQLVEQNTGVNLVNQSLPYTGLSDVLVPLTVNIAQGTQFVISLDQINSILPNTINVYLEDTLENTATLLNTVDFNLTPNTDLSGSGRFYLRFTDNALSNPSVELDSYQIFAVNKTLHVNGIFNEKAQIKLYDIQGRLMLNVPLLNSVSEQTVNLQSVNSGVYIAVLDYANNSKTKKVIIK